MLPLIVRDQPLGAIVFGFDGERDFDDADRSFLDALATQCAIALDRAAANDLGADELAGLICDAVVNAFDTPLGDDMAILVLRRHTG
jgi:GAF domain-containing protein